MIIKVEEGQTIYDITVQHYGDISKIQKLLDDNNLNRDDALYSGQELYVDKYFPKDTISNYFINKNINNFDSIKEYDTLENSKVHIINIQQPKNPTLNNTWVVEEGQTIYDVATMFYGSPDKVHQLFIDNPTLENNSVLYSGQILKLTFNNNLNNIVYSNIINNDDSEHRYVGEFRLNVLQIKSETPSNLGFAYLEVLGGIEPYTYLWSRGDDTLNLLSAHTGNYTITVTDNENNELTLNIYIPFYEDIPLLSKPNLKGSYYSDNLDNILTSNGDRILINK